MSFDEISKCAVHAFKGDVRPTYTIERKQTPWTSAMGQFRPRTFIGDMSASRLKSPIADSLPPAPNRPFIVAAANFGSWRIPLKKSAIVAQPPGGEFGRSRLALSCGPDLRPVWQKLGEFPEILGCCGEMELVSGAVRSAQAQPVEPQDALEMGEEHLDLLPLSPRDDIGVGLRDVSGHVAGTLVRILRAGVLGQHCGFSEQASQANLLAW